MRSSYVCISCDELETKTDRLIMSQQMLWMAWCIIIGAKAAIQHGKPLTWKAGITGGYWIFYDSDNEEVTKDE